MENMQHVSAFRKLTEDAVTEPFGMLHVIQQP